MYPDLASPQCIGLKQYRQQQNKSIMANFSTYSLLLLSSLMVVVSSFSISMPDVFDVVGSEMALTCKMSPPFQGNLSIEMYVDGTEIGPVVSTSDSPFSLVKEMNTESVQSGTFKCTFSDQSRVIIQDAKYGIREIPNTPQSVSVDCRADQFSATVTWTPGSNLGQVTNFSIEANTPFEPHYWFSMGSVDSSKTAIDLTLNGLGDYTFRVLANNEAASSQPSESTDVCVTPQTRPGSNPQHVESLGNETGYLIVHWQAMPRILHSGDGFRYKLTYKKVGQTSPATTISIPDWTITEKKIQTGDVYTPYEVTVSAENNMGTSIETAETHTLYSSESAPTVSVPLLEIGRVESHPASEYQVSADYIWKWDKQLEESSSMNGAFGGFRIEHWLPSAWDPDSYRQYVTISKNDMKPVADCGSPDGFYHINVPNLEANQTYKSHINVENTYFHGPVTTVSFRAVRAEVENLRTDCCDSRQKKINVSWDMYEDRINPDGIQGRLLAFKILLSHSDGMLIVDVNNSIPIEDITRVSGDEGLVTFSTLLIDLSLDLTYSLRVIPVRERCDWSVPQMTSFKTKTHVGAAMSARSDLVAIVSALVLYRVIYFHSSL
ncbi:hypothetical protein ScPMuIL_017306 [Solemya velum]